MINTKFDETYIFKISIKSDTFDISFSKKIPFFRVSFTIEPGSLLQFVTTNCLIKRLQKNSSRLQLVLVILFAKRSYTYFKINEAQILGLSHLKMLNLNDSVKRK